jgi:two-component system capsular synthesis response regulator RcsB
MTIRIILADDHPAVLAGIQHELQGHPTFEIVGLARNAQELTELLKTCPCDVLVTDYAMPDGTFKDGMALITHLHDNHPTLKIIVFTTLDNPALSAALKEKGVSDVVNKASESGQLAAKIKAVYAAPAQPRKFVAANEPSLSVREEEVVRLFVSGLSINEIAERLERTKQTISSQKTNAMLKLGLTRDADLFRFALETGLVTAETLEGKQD